LLVTVPPKRPAAWQAAVLQVLLLHSPCTPDDVLVKLTKHPIMLGRLLLLCRHTLHTLLLLLLLLFAVLLCMLHLMRCCQVPLLQVL
jgi:hypothetical protein